MQTKKITFLLMIMLGIQAAYAGSESLPLDSCRKMAIEHNKELKISALQKKTAYYNRKSATTSYLPKVSVTGMYMHTGKEISLLSGKPKPECPLRPRLI